MIDRWLKHLANIAEKSKNKNENSSEIKNNKNKNRDKGGKKNGKM